MLNKRRFFKLIFTVLMLTCFSVSNAWAITSITSTLTPTAYSVEGVPRLLLNKGDTFSFSLTAIDPIGEITWILTYIANPGVNETPDPTLITDGSITLSATTGNTITVNGSLANEHGYSVSIVASDSSGTGNNNIMSQYSFWIQNTKDFPSNSDGNEIVPVPAPTNPDGEDNTTKVPEKLHVGIIEAVSDEYKTEDLLQKLANNASIDRSDIRWLPSDAIDTSEPPEPTQSMRDQVAKDSYQFAAKLNTLKVSEDGYYVFQVTVSDDLVGTKASDLKLYYADEDEFSGASASLAFFGLMPAINGITGSLEVSNMLGVKLDTLPKQFLATMFLSASKSITVYIVRILLLLLGGCNVGIGIAGTLIIGVVTVKFFKKCK